MHFISFLSRLVVVLGETCRLQGRYHSHTFHSRRVIFQRFFPNKILLNIFSLLPAPLHVAYRDKNEDDDLEKAYKEVCDSLSAMLTQFLAFLFTSSMIDRRQRFVRSKCV